VFRNRTTATLSVRLESETTLRLFRFSLLRFSGHPSTIPYVLDAALILAASQHLTIVRPGLDDCSEVVEVSLFFFAPTFASNRTPLTDEDERRQAL
jgi:hypothetical protein